MEYKLFTPKLSSEIEKQEYIQAMASGEVSYAWMNGGMGIDFSNETLATAVIAEDGIGVLSASFVGYNDVYEQLSDIRNKEERMKLTHGANKTKILEEIKYVRDRFPHAVLGVNLMKAVSDYESLVKTIGESKEVDLLFVGAGLPTDLPATMENYSHMHYVPIISSVRAAHITMMRAERGRKPAAFYVELPQLAGGHLGAKDVADTEDIEKFSASKISKDMKEKFPNIPIILAGGIAYSKDIIQAFEDAYNGISIGTRMLLTQESGLPDHLIKDMYLSNHEKVITGMTSPAGLPSRYLVNKEFHKKASEIILETKQRCVSCIGNEKCKFFNDKSQEYIPGKSHYCIAHFLSATRRGEKWGLPFTGSRITEIIKDSLYNKDGKIYIPTVKEVVEFMFSKISIATA